MEQDDRALSADLKEAQKAQADSRGLSHGQAREDYSEEWFGEEAGRQSSQQKGLAEDCAFATSGDLIVRDMPEIKVLEYLKNETSTLDIGKTIKNLFESMQNMDAHLSSVLAINAVLEKDIKASKEVIAKLKAERAELDDTITTLREEIPSKRLLQAEIGHLIEERNDAQASIRSMKLQVERIKSEAQSYQKRVTELESEKADLARDINYLDTKCDTSVKKLNAYAKELSILRGERLSNIEKIENLKLQYSKCLEDKKN
jgi:chromosome segregation ATPase